VPGFPSPCPGGCLQIGEVAPDESAGELRVPAGGGNFIIRILASTLACVVLLVGATTRAADDPERERLVRGALLYKFAKFVEWPQDLGAESEPLQLCVLGDPAFAQLIQTKVDGLKVKGHPIAVRDLSKPGEVRDCHIAYYSESENLAAALEALGDAAVLTVASQDGFLEQGGMVNLVRREDSVGFEINLGASRKAGLDLSARLLEAALRVENN
jgi:hypothetical protein